VPKRDPHDILGIERGAGMVAVKAAWRRLARAHHPDLSGSDPAAARAATARMAEINAAYDLLRQHDAERRAGVRDRGDYTDHETDDGASTGPDAAARGTAGPPRPRPTRPVTGRVDTSGTFRPRNSTTGPRSTVAGSGIRMAGTGTPPRARPADRQPPRASDPTGPLRRRRPAEWTPPPEPSIDDARARELGFGKFHGHTLGQVADFEPSYIDWLAATISHDPDLVAAARVLRRHLDGQGIRRRSRPPRRPAPPAG
jgi:curved DNA-binding protein CbpA